MISDDLFDALHGQDFMKRILRDGNPIRDRIIATCASSIFLKV
jgi:hypothetical protein